MRRTYERCKGTDEGGSPPMVSSPSVDSHFLGGVASRRRVTRDPEALTLLSLLVLIGVATTMVAS